MTTSDIIAIVAAVIAFASLGVALFASSKANAISAEQLKLSHAQLEISVRNQIKESRRHTEEFYEKNSDFLAKDPAKLTPDEKQKRARLIIASNSAIEGYISALDEACQKYLDGKLDRVRFKKGYQTEIRQAVQDKGHEDFLKTGHRFHALIKVFDEWENTEK